MRKTSPRRRVGVVSQRLSEEESPYTGASAELLTRFLSSVDFTCPQPPRTWECNPLYRELKRTLQGTIHMEQVEELLREKYNQASLLSSFPSAQSTVTTISSAQSGTLRDSDVNPSSSTLDSGDNLWWKPAGQSRTDKPSTDNPPSQLARRSALISEITPADGQRKGDRTATGMKSKAGLEGLEGQWKLKLDEPVKLLDLCNLMEMDRAEMDQREEHVHLEIRLMGHLLCVKSEIFGLYNVEVPVNGEVSRLPRIDQHKGVMSAHIETKRQGLRMIYTWDHPAAATRRDSYEVSANGKKLTLTAYLSQRDGHYCKVKWQFEKVDHA